MSVKTISPCSSKHVLSKHENDNHCLSKMALDDGQRKVTSESRTSEDPD